MASGLLTRDQLDQARAALRPFGGEPRLPHSSRTDEQLADKLVEMGRLNPWQAKQLLDGRTKFNLGPYWIVDSLGRGGMGQVFKGEHGVLGRVVAIKVLPRSKSTPEAIANFTREIRAQAKLDHENLVRALDAGEDGNVYYLVTEYVPGTDLRKLVRRHGKLAMQAAASVVSQTAAGLQHAHEQGLIHRDVKPGNVLVTPDGHAKLSDLGLAGPLMGDAENDPRFGKIVGTADYLSPDHIKAPWDPTPAWDIYSLGCTLYYGVTGKVPFPGGSTADKARAHCELRPLDPRRLNAELDAEFVEVLADMMAKDPAERIRTAAEVIVRLEPWTGPPMPVPLGDHERRKPPGPAKPVMATPPPVKERPSSADPPPEEPDDPGLQDTESSFPEMPELTPGQKDNSSQSSQATDPVASSGEETSSVVKIMGAEAGRPSAIFHPVVVLVLLPVALVAIVMLIWWVFQSVG